MLVYLIGVSGGVVGWQSVWNESTSLFGNIFSINIQVLHWATGPGDTSHGHPQWPFPSRSSPAFICADDLRRPATLRSGDKVGIAPKPRDCRLNCRFAPPFEAMMIPCGAKLARPVKLSSAIDLCAEHHESPH